MTDNNGRLIDLEKKFSSDLLMVENPARYFGSEFYYGNKEYKATDIKCAICFPDLYEIGMSNNAVRILYDLYNRVEGVFADRAFCPAPDFEKLLREKNIPLFTLKEHFALNKLDYIGLTLSSELASTNILQLIDLGGMNIHSSERIETDPVIILGGPAATNPLPFSKFVDFVHIGEGEADSLELINILKKYKKRSERIEAIKKLDFFWYPGKEITKRAVDNNFGTSFEDPKLKYFVVPSFEVAQDHGTVEIMRGCPNGCRFCHAGQFYKPFRQRKLESVYELVKQNVEEFGYREITLSSLSSGDYPDLDLLMKALNTSYKEKGISFSLPSLKVSSFSLGILEQLSEVRKSGLTFAIETPLLNDQRSMNKEVPVEQIIEIIQEAKRRGWKLAKFYFMVGLPFVDKDTEQVNIVNFLSRIREATKINMNINIGTFIPKAHTPFQWARQFTMQESEDHLRSIKRALMASIPGIKVSYHEPSISFLEGVISRGDSKCADLIEKAYELGSRLDAWDEYINFDNWVKAIEETKYDTSKNEFDIDEDLPWDGISLNVSKAYLIKEYNKAKNHELTSICSESCEHNCGVCGCKASKVVKAVNGEFKLPDEKKEYFKPEDYYQVEITYSKKGRAIFNSHISVMRQFEMAFQRSNLSIKFTEGFNPKPRIEFANPIAMGVTGENEMLLCELPIQQVNDDLISKLNKNLSDGFKILSYKIIPHNETGKKISLASLMLGSELTISDITSDDVRNCLENDMSKESSDFTIRKENDIYYIHINGEKNMFKLLFEEDMNKFYIAGSCNITRNKLLMQDF